MRNLKTNREFFCVLIDGPHCRLIRWWLDTFTRGSPHISVVLLGCSLRPFIVTQRGIATLLASGKKPGWQHSRSQGEGSWGIPSFPHADFHFLLIFTSLTNSFPLFVIHKLEAVLVQFLLLLLLLYWNEEVNKGRVYVLFIQIFKQSFCLNPQPCLQKYLDP